MGLFSRNKAVTLFNPVAGEVVALEDVHDEMFASKVMGDGFGIFPTNGDIYSPIKAKVTAIFPTKHAISLVTKGGVEVLIHIGIDTVELNGEGFDISVEVDDQVDENTLLANVDLSYLQAQEKPTDVMVIFTNLAKEKLKLDLGKYGAKEQIGELE